MAVTSHDGTEIAEISERMSPLDSEIFYVSWGSKFESDETMASSSWILPADWTEESTADDATVTVDGTAYEHTNRITLSTTKTRGKYPIINEVVTSKRTLRRGFLVQLDACL